MFKKPLFLASFPENSPKTAFYLMAYFSGKLKAAKMGKLKWYYLRKKFEKP